jgi:hypothetical protein
MTSEPTASPPPSNHASRGHHAAQAAPSQSTPPSALRHLQQLLYEQGGLIAGLLPAEPTFSAEPSAPAGLAARGPRAATAPNEYQLLIELIYEGYLLHYRPPRLLHPPDRDLGLLAGDRLYALGLARLVALGDLPAVAELADVITLTALAHGSGLPELADAIWLAGALAVGWGSSDAHAHAKALARSGAPQALGAMRALLA